MTNTVLYGAVTTLLATAIVYLCFISKSERKALNKDEFQKFPLIEKIVLSKDSAIFRFGLPNPTDVLGLPIGQHIQIQANIDNKNVLHSYTPTTLDQDAKGFFDLLIKVYPNGKLSTYIDNLKLGETINVKGPKGFYNYQQNMLKHICMVAGGTGITPMYQIMKAIASDPNENTKVTLLYGSQTEDDILLKQELDELSKSNKNLEIIYYLDKSNDGWNGKTGYITKDALIEHFPKPNDDVQLLICGPPGLCASIKKASNELQNQYQKQVIKYSYFN